MTRVLVVYGSRHGGTKGIAERIGEVLRTRGIDAAVTSAELCEDRDVNAADAFVVGSGVYMGSWLKEPLAFIERYEETLAACPLWLFSSGPLDPSAESGDIPPVRQVRRLMDRIAADGHQTFGGRLEPDAPGFVAHAMAKKLAGDWRDPDHVNRWTTEIVDRLAHPVEAQAS